MPTISFVVSLETMGKVVTDLMFHIFLRQVSILIIVHPQKQQLMNQWEKME